ncbi:MAG: prepilin-type N-terminal cleavage/methylation domain-containing protein [Pseudomonadota bacterium]|nr:prepilin-type N-terminal cleavage/methylation domain-containing protein [Pseudomonadota bacterium]
MIRKFNGFTIIELVVVLVLVGITATIVAPRYMGPNAFDQSAAQDALLTTIRAAQQAALGRSNVSFAIGQAGNAWVMTVTADPGASTLRTADFPARSVILETGSAASSGDTCESGFDDAVAANFLLTFDAKGNLASFVNGANSAFTSDPAFNAVRICVNDTAASSVCVSRAGYAYAGTCDA